MLTESEIFVIFCERQRLKHVWLKPGLLHSWRLLLDYFTWLNSTAHIVTDSKLMDLFYLGLIYLMLSLYLMLFTWQEEQSNYYFSIGYKLITLHSSFKRSIVLTNILKQHA